MADRTAIITAMADTLDTILDASQEVAGAYIAARLDHRFDHAAAGPDPGGLEQQYPLHLTDAAQGVLYIAGAKLAMGSAIAEVFELNTWRTEFLGAIADGILLQGQPLDPHAAVRVATTANITLSGAQTIDGVAVVAGDRVLVKDQTTGAQNGVYVAASGAWARATDMDATGELIHGTFVAVLLGTSHAGQSWICTTNNPITLGTTATVWELYQGSQVITAGDGLVQVGNAFNVGAGTGIDVAADSISISATYAGQASIVTVGTLTAGDWNASPIGPTYGGTGITTYALGDILYGSGVNTLAKLAGNTTSTKKFLRQTGTGSISAIPAWDTLVDADIPGTLVRSSRLVSTTGPLQGGGDLSADRTISIVGLTGLGTANQVPGANAAGTAWEYKSFAGTVNRITVNPSAGTYTWDISSSYAGQASITTVGTITTGTWNGTVITLAYGGTGISSYAVGDMIYASGVSTLSRLLGNITTTRKFLQSTGNGSVAAAPVWDTLVNGDIPTALTGKTYNGLTLTAAAVGFTIAGGTTSKTLTVSLDATVSGTNTGDQTIALTGDVTGSGTGTFATTIATNAVSSAKFRQATGISVVGNATGSIANVTDIAAPGGSGYALREVGNALGWGTLTSSAIADRAITFAKIGTVSAGVILGRITAGAGSIEELTASQARTNMGISTSDSPSFTGLTISGFAANRIVYTTTGGALTTSANFNLDGTTLSGTKAFFSSDFTLGSSSLVAGAAMAYNAGTGSMIFTPASFAIAGDTATLQFGALTAEHGPYKISVLASGSATPATKGTGSGRNLTITAGASDNSTAKTGGDLYLRPGIPTSPSTVYGDVWIADQGGVVSVGGTTAGAQFSLTGKTGVVNSYVFDLQRTAGTMDIYCDSGSDRFVRLNNDGAGTLGLKLDGRINIAGATDLASWAINVAGGANISTSGMGSLVSYGVGVPGDTTYERMYFGHNGAGGAEFTVNKGPSGGSYRALTFNVGGAAAIFVSTNQNVRIGSGSLTLGYKLDVGGGGRFEDTTLFLNNIQMGATGHANSIIGASPFDLLTLCGGSTIAAANSAFINLFGVSASGSPGDMELYCVTNRTIKLFGNSFYEGSLQLSSAAKSTVGVTAGSHSFNVANKSRILINSYSGSSAIQFTGMVDGQELHVMNNSGSLIGLDGCSTILQIGCGIFIVYDLASGLWF